MKRIAAFILATTVATLHCTAFAADDAKPDPSRQRSSATEARLMRDLAGGPGTPLIPHDGPPTFIDRSHPGTLTSTSGGATLHWSLAGNDDGNGVSTFIANGSFATAIHGTRLVLQDGAVYAKQLDGSWIAGSLYGGNATTVKVFDSGPAPIPPELTMSGEYTPGDVLRVDLTNEAALRAVAPRGTTAEPFAYEPEFTTGPSGINYLRFASSPKNERLISWRIQFPPMDDVYARYLIWPEHDVVTNMTEIGVKLPGLAGGEVTWRMEHKPPRNDGYLPVVDYLYDAERGTVGFPGFRAMGGAMFIPDRWTSVEQHIKLNRPGVADGVGEVWINGHSVWRSDTELYRKDPATKINHFFANVYHGGVGKFFVPPAHYRIARIEISSRYIGVPTELVSAQDAAATTKAQAASHSPRAPDATPATAR
ncbi:MAG: polysaccharide lyase [Betaproteobacteria bacterium]